MAACPKSPTEISRGPRFEMQIKEQGAERARRTQVRRSERSDAVTQRCAQSGGSRLQPDLDNRPRRASEQLVDAAALLGGHQLAFNGRDAVVDTHVGLPRRAVRSDIIDTPRLGILGAHHDRDARVGHFGGVRALVDALPKLERDHIAALVDGLEPARGGVDPSQVEVRLPVAGLGCRQLLLQPVHRATQLVAAKRLFGKPGLPRSV